MRQTGLIEERTHVFFGAAVEDRRRERETEDLADVSEMGLENLAHVHPARNTERIEDDLDRRAVGQVGQILDRQNPRDDALVAVAAGHLVSDLELALHGDVDLDQLDDARRQLVSLLQELDPLLVHPVQDRLDVESLLR